MGFDNTSTGMSKSMLFGDFNGGSGDLNATNNLYFGDNNQSLGSSYSLMFGNNNIIQQSSYSFALGYGARIDLNNDYIFALGSKKKWDEGNIVSGGNVFTVNKEGDVNISGTTNINGGFNIQGGFTMTGELTCSDIRLLDNIYIGTPNDGGETSLTEILRNVIDLSLNYTDVSNVFFTNSFNGLAFSGADISCNIRDAAIT